jgi:hypothetical protein
MPGVAASARPPVSQRINAALRRVPVWPVYALGALPPF